MSGLTHRAIQADSPNRSIGSLETVIRRARKGAGPTSLPRNASPIKLKIVKLFRSCLLLVLGAVVACGESNGGPTGTGGSDGNPLAEQSSYFLNCTIDTLVLEIPIELYFELDRPYIEGGSADLTFSAVVTFDEQAATNLIDAGIPNIDIISVKIASWVDGATPETVETSLAAAPINDFDLAVDTNDNEIAGPHRLELDTVTITTTVTKGADEVELGLGLDQVSLLLGSFNMPTDCVAPTLVGFTARFPVEPPD